MSKLIDLQRDVLVALAWLAATVGTTGVQADIAGARDPVDFPRYPGAEIVVFTADQAPTVHEFITSPVEKIRRELKVEQKLRTTALSTSAVYLLPSGTPLQEAKEHYSGLLSPEEVLFTCEGRDCGRSNQWANQVFGEAILYGPDRNQLYLAGRRDEQLLSVYVIQRGNRKVYVRIETLTPDQDVSIATNQRLVRELAGRGHIAIDGVEPLRDGGLDATATQVLQKLAPMLDVLAKEEVYVVCHLYRPGDISESLALAEACAQSAADLLDTDVGPELIPFGAGPLLPRAGDNKSRVELVMPHRQDRG